jgi:hypothetical protein
MKPNCNILYYFNKNREFNRFTEMLDKVGVKYIPIRIHEGMIDETFIYTMLDYYKNGTSPQTKLNFDDLMKKRSSQKWDFDLDAISTKQLVKKIVENPSEYLVQAWFLGVSGGEGVITTQRFEEDDLTIYIPYNEREMKQIYG